MTLEVDGPRPLPKAYRLPGKASDTLRDRRRLRAAELRMQGFTLETIGRKLHADPAANSTGEGWPIGYGWQNYHRGLPPVSGHSLVVEVCRDLDAAWRHARIANETVRQHAIQLQIDRMETAMAAHWGRVLDGNARSFEVWMRGWEGLNNLQGLYPEKSAIHQHLHVQATVDSSPAIPWEDPKFLSDLTAALRSCGALGEGQDLAAALTQPEVIDADVVADEPDEPDVVADDGPLTEVAGMEVVHVTP